MSNGREGRFSRPRSCTIAFRPSPTLVLAESNGNSDVISAVQADAADLQLRKFIQPKDGLDAAFSDISTYFNEVPL